MVFSNLIIILTVLYWKIDKILQAILPLDADPFNSMRLLKKNSHQGGQTAQIANLWDLLLSKFKVSGQGFAERLNMMEDAIEKLLRDGFVFKTDRF